MTRPVRVQIPLAILLALILLAPAAAQASPNQLSIMMDDDNLLYRGDDVRDQTLTKMRQLGVDVVRVTVLWNVVAERTRKLGARASNPGAYPARNWDRYDNLVREAARLGMRVFFTLTGPGPSYAHRRAPRSQRRNAGTYRPYASRFRAFAEAVGRRYSGTYRDENGARRALARVTMWSTWNEPNQPGWLSPQWERVNGQNVPVAPALYRQLHQAAVAGLERAGHRSQGGELILLGETAPLGSTERGPRNGIRPVPFLREMLCLAPNGTPYTGADAARRDCDDFARNPTLKADGFAHHPYTKKVAPTVPPKSPDEITMANIGSLGPLLDALAAQSGGKIAAGLPIYLTEFGYESNPPDPRNGIPYFRQAEFNQLADFLAYNDPRVAATTQFLLRDVGPLRRYRNNPRLYWFTYQSGLYTVRGRAKPAAYGYIFPFIAFAGGDGGVGFWGQMRFRPNGVDGDAAVVMWRPSGSAPWQQVGDPIPTSPRGFFTGAVAPPGAGGEYRAVYVDPRTGKVSVSSLPDKP